MSEHRKHKTDLLDPPSEDFENLVCDGGTSDATCELCGREHFATENPGWEPGELEACERKLKEEPERWVRWDGDDSVRIGTIDGQQVVIGCPCNGLRRFEDFIWRHSSIIGRYLSKRWSDTMEDTVARARDSISLAAYEDLYRQVTAGLRDAVSDLKKKRMALAEKLMEED